MLSIALISIDWSHLFSPSTSLVEIVIRGSVIYLGIFVLLRAILKRQVGAIGLNDMLVVVLISDAAQNGLSGGYDSISEGILLVATIMAWDYALDWLGFHSGLFRRLSKPSPLPLIINGRLLYRNMRKELITEEEIKGHLRQEGIDDISQVKAAYVEEDGHISVVDRKG